MQLHIHTATTLQNTPQPQTLFTASEAPKTRVISDQLTWHASIEAVCQAEKNALDMTWYCAQFYAQRTDILVKYIHSVHDITEDV